MDANNLSRYKSMIICILKLKYELLYIFVEVIETNMNTKNKTCSTWWNLY